MVTSEDLAKLAVRNIIFHDVPNNLRGASNEPVLADTETELDPKRAKVLKDRLVQVLGSKTAYPVDFHDDTSSPVPGGVKAFTARSHPVGDFIEMSRMFARYLFEQQSGAISPGLLCVIDVVSAHRAGIALLKLEREQGAELELRERDGKRMFEMSVLDNLVLTDGTRLFKSAIFLRNSSTKVLAAACDSQRKTTTSDEVARFWLRFLGCKFQLEPRVATQRWFDATVHFVNEVLTDPIEKNDIYEHLLSELKSNKRNVTPKSFVEDYIPRTYRRNYVEYLSTRGIPLVAFEKDTSDIHARLRRKTFYTSKGVTVTAPLETEQLVDVRANQIVVHDHLQSIAQK